MLPNERTPKVLPWPFANLLTRSSTSQGPSCVALCVPSIQHLVPKADPCVVDNPCNISGSLFMTREVELCLAVGEHIDCCWKAINDTGNLPASKTDPKALGKRRTLGCGGDGDLGSKWASLKSDTLIAVCETLDCSLKKVALPPFVDPDAAAVSSCRTLLPLGCWTLTVLGMTPREFIGPYPSATKLQETLGEQPVVGRLPKQLFYPGSAHDPTQAPNACGKSCCVGCVARSLSGCDIIWSGQLRV
jgi:hypothetical protein